MTVHTATDAGCIISAEAEGAVLLWIQDYGVHLGAPIGHYVSYSDRVPVTPDGRYAVFAPRDSDATVQVWDLTNNIRTHILRYDEGPVEAICVLPDGYHLAAGGFDRTMRVWDIRTGECLCVYHSTGYSPCRLRARPDGLVVCGMCEGDVRILQLLGFSLGPPIVTAVRLWRFGSGLEQGKLDDDLTALCPWCDRRFVVDHIVLDAAAHVVRDASLSSEQPACPVLPEGAFAEQRLLSRCSRCAGPLKFNPFVVDSRDGY
jgi:hypothetical protein